MKNCDLKLARHGAILVTLGILSGFATVGVPAPRMALAAHNIGIIQGTLTIALGFLWPVLVAHGYTLRVSRIALLIGLYCNWLGALLSAIWSAKMMAIVSGANMPDGATPWQEVTVAVLLNVSILVLLVFIRLIWVISQVVRKDPQS